MRQVKNLIHLKNLVKTYQSPEGSIEIIKIPSFQLESGSQLSLMGPSGCGKTTLLNMISGIIAPDAGSIEINGVGVDKLSESQKDVFRSRNIGYVFQNINLIHSLTSMENVMLPMSFAAIKSKAEQRQEAESLLKRLRLGHRLNHKPFQLSRGEQQRVAIARALANKPPLLLADEPTGNIDYSTGVQVVELLARLSREEEATLMMVTHNREFASLLPEIREIQDINRAFQPEREGVLWES